jgi:hypothetical protein
MKGTIFWKCFTHNVAQIFQLTGRQDGNDQEIMNQFISLGSEHPRCRAMSFTVSFNSMDDYQEAVDTIAALSSNYQIKPKIITVGVVDSKS